jgi:RNA polymerase sigma factor (sigma-70 family)
VRTAARDAGSMTAEANAAVERNMGIAYAVALRAWRRFRTFADLEDFQQAATMGLMRAVQYYDPSRQCKLSTLAYRLSWQSCMGMIDVEVARHARGVRPRQFPVSEKTGKVLDVADRRLGPAELAEEVEAAAYLHRGLAAAMAKIDPRSRLVLEYRAIGETLEQVGARLGGLSKERVRQIQIQATERVRRIMGVDVTETPSRPGGRSGW